MPPTGNAGRVTAADLRSRARSAVRRRIQRLAAVAQRPQVQTAPKDAAQRQQSYERLLSLYQSLGRAFGPHRIASSELPSASDVNFVRREALRGKVFRDFFMTLSLDGDFDAATVATTRKLIEKSRSGRARSFLEVFRRYPELRPLAEVCLGICFFVSPVRESAWTLFTRNDLGLVLKWAAAEYFELAFARDPDGAESTLERVLQGDIPFEADAAVWIDVAYHAFAAGRVDLAERCLEQATTAVAAVRDDARADHLRARVTTLQEWVGRARRARRVVDIPADEIPFALVGFEHPDSRAVSRDLSGALASLAVLGHLLRYENVTFAGDPGLVSVAERLRADVAPEHRRSGGERTVRLFEVARDLSKYAEIPDGTWVVVSDWFHAPLVHWRYDIPLDHRLRPIFISFRIDPRQLATPGAVEYLRAHGPVGCRDWETVYLLHAAGVPAFFSGALETTLDIVVPSATPKPASGRVFVDTASSGGSARRGQLSAAHRELGENLTAAAEALRSYRDGGKRVVTTDRGLHLGLRAVGGSTRFRPEQPWDGETTDYVEVSDDALAAMRQSISDKLAAVLGALIDGASAEKVYETWRDACADDVARAEREMRSFPDFAKLDFNLQEVCDAIRARSLTVERREPGPSGPEINVEFSLDQNYVHQLEVSLDSIVEHATRPVRAFLLSRGLPQEDFDRVVRSFPTVSFEWLRIDGIAYGDVGGKNKWVSIVTMDRTILSALLPEVDRIIHFDLDALCLSDLAELFDVDMKGAAIAACDSPNPKYSGGFSSVRHNANRLRRVGRPDLARELLIRTHAEHSFDFHIFNAGIMVLDLAKMRADDFTGRYLSYVPRFGVNGQNVLNFYVGSARTKVDADWNRVVTVEVVPPPKVAHWAGPVKPWAGHRYVPHRELWREQEKRFEQRVRALSAGAAGAA